MRLYTIGFTKKSAATFFGLLRDNSIARLVDVRVSNSSQLAGFTKSGDLTFFLQELCGAAYTHVLELAPTRAMLKDYRSGVVSWPEYAAAIEALFVDRRVETLPRELFDGPTALLCSEPTAERCHRRLAAEHLAAAWKDVAVIHL